MRAGMCEDEKRREDGMMPGGVSRISERGNVYLFFSIGRSPRCCQALGNSGELLGAAEHPATEHPIYHTASAR
jgi:hypothetical protein